MDIAVIRDLTRQSERHACTDAWLFAVPLSQFHQLRRRPSPPPPVKIEQLLKLLDDPDVKAWITTKGTTAAAEIPAVAFNERCHAVVERHSGAYAGHRASHSGATRRVCRGKLHDHDRNQRSRCREQSLSCSLLLLRSALEPNLSFRRLVRQASEPNVASSTIEVGSPARHHLIGRAIFAAIAPLVVFALASIGAFLAFTWPPLLAMLVLSNAHRPDSLAGDYADGRHPTRNRKEQLNDDSQGMVRLIPMDDVMAAFWYRRVRFLVDLLYWVGGRPGDDRAQFHSQVKSLIVYINRPWPSWRSHSRQCGTAGSARCRPGLSR